MRWSIRAKLAVLVLAVLLPLITGAGYRFWNDLRERRADVQADMLATARTVARHLDEVLSGQIENLEVLSSLQSLSRIHDDELSAIATRLRARHPFVHAVVAAGPDGRIAASSESPAERAPSLRVDVGALASVLNERAPTVVVLNQSSMRVAPRVALLMPILDAAGVPQGVVAEEIDLSALSAFVDRLRQESRSSVAVITDDGTLVALSGAPRDTLGTKLSLPAAGVPGIRDGRGVVEWRWDDGVTRLATAAGMTAAPWTVVAAMPSDVAYASAASRLRANLFSLGIATLAALSVGWLISRRMIRAVKTLTKAAKGLADGRASAIAADSGDELAEVAEQFNRAMDERRRAEAARDARQRRIQALAEINLSLSRQLDREALLHQVTAALARLTGARNVALWDADHTRRTLARRAGYTDASISSVDLPETLTFEQGGTGWVARHGLALFIEDVTHDERIVAADWALRHNLVAFAAVPVVAGNDLLGVLTLNLERGTLPQGDDRALLSIFASQAAVAVHNARLFAEAHTRRRAAETLSELGQALAHALDLDTVGQRIADSVRALLNAQSAGLYRVEADTGDLVPLAVSGIATAVLDRSLRFPSGTGISALAVAERRTIATPDLLTDPRVVLTPEARARIEQATYRSVLAIPLIVKDTVIGALAVGDRENRWFDSEEIKLAQSFADQAALALDNARLYEETSQRLRHLDSLREVVEQILIPVSLDARLTVIGRKAAELFDADRAAIALLEGTELVVKAGHGLREHELGRVVSHGVGVMGLAASRRQGLLVNDYETWPQRDPYIVDAYRDRPAQAVIGCPLMIRDQVIGTMTVGLHAPGKRFVQADLDRLATLAVPAALAIEHSRLYDELAARLRELQETQAQLLQAGKLSAVGQLVSGVAHELNNPLSVVIGYGQLLMNRELPPQIRRPVELIVAQGDRMARIVQSLLLFSRQRRPERGAVDVREAIEQTLGLRATQLMLSGIHVQCAYGEDVPAAEGDANQLQQVFLNLLLNAEQSILGSVVGEHRAGDRIRVSTGTRERDDKMWVVIEVADNGPGIPPDVLPRIFEPFFTTKKVGEGTGLGLSVSYGIVQQHGGTLAVRSQPGHTVFTVEIPAMKDAVMAAHDSVAEVPLADGNGRVALVVDDEQTVVELVTTLLNQAGWKVDVANGGPMALECLRRGRYDLVVSDVRMPDGGGEAFYRVAITEHEQLARRFLFMTGDTANPDAWQFLQRVGAHVIEKPFTAHALLSAVERVMA